MPFALATSCARPGDDVGHFLLVDGTSQTISTSEPQKTDSTSFASSLNGLGSLSPWDSSPRRCAPQLVEDDDWREKEDGLDR